MFSAFIRTISALSLAAMASVPAVAQDRVALDSTVQVERQVSENGASRTVLSPPEGVVPGDRLLFSTSYANRGGEVAENFVVTNPLPTAVRLAEDGDFDVSIDGGKTYARLSDLSVNDGELGPRAAEPRDVTHIRWTLASLAPGADGTLSYYAIVR